ncbi:hypothetical protein PJP14_30040, partial [Mycobacterium kansasii]
IMFKIVYQLGNDSNFDKRLMTTAIVANFYDNHRYLAILTEIFGVGDSHHCFTAIVNAWPRSSTLSLPVLPPFD